MARSQNSAPQSVIHPQHLLHHLVKLLREVFITLGQRSPDGERILASGGQHHHGSKNTARPPIFGLICNSKQQLCTIILARNSIHGAVYSVPPVLGKQHPHPTSCSAGQARRATTLTAEISESQTQRAAHECSNTNSLQPTAAGENRLLPSPPPGLPQ